MMSENLDKEVKLGTIIDLIENEIFEWEMNGKGRPNVNHIIELLKDYSIEYDDKGPTLKTIPTTRSWDKPNEYDEDGFLKNMDVGDWIVTHGGEVRKIIHDDMNDLKAEDINRFATRKEVRESERK